MTVFSSKFAAISTGRLIYAMLVWFQTRDNPRAEAMAR